VRQLRLPAQPDGAGRAVPVLGQVQFDLPGQVGVGVVAVQQDHLVAVLLERARFAQVGEQGALVGALGCTAVELGEHHDRHVVVAGQQLQRPGQVGHHLLPVRGLVRRLGVEQLQVVHEDQAQVAVAAQGVAGAAADVGDGGDPVVEVQRPVADDRRGGGAGRRSPPRDRVRLVRWDRFTPAEAAATRSVSSSADISTEAKYTPPSRAVTRRSRRAWWRPATCRRRGGRRRR
jgi:hypothetical protein